MKRISKFDCWVLSRCCDYWHFAVFNAQKYTIEEVKEELIKEMEYDNETVIFGDEPGNYQIDKVFVKWSTGRNENDELCVGWVEYFDRTFEKGMIPAYGVRFVSKNDYKTTRLKQCEFIQSDLVKI